MLVVTSGNEGAPEEVVPSSSSGLGGSTSSRRTAPPSIRESTPSKSASLVGK